MKSKHQIYCLRLLGVLAITSGWSVLFNRLELGRENILMLFNVGVLLTSYITSGYQYGILASLFSVMFFNYAYTEPKGSFWITDREDFILTAFFLATTLLTSNLKVRLQKQLKLARENEQLAKELSLEQERIQFAMEKEQMRSHLLRSISHDLRTPLTGIAGASSLIEESAGKLDEESITSLAKDINEQAEWLIQLIENILNMTKIESGNLCLEKKPEAAEDDILAELAAEADTGASEDAADDDILAELGLEDTASDEMIPDETVPPEDDVIHNAVTYVKGRLKQRTISVSIPEEVLFAEMDGKMIVQVLINLLDNSIKHTKEEGKIELKAWKEKNKIWFCVADNGTGIKKQYLDKIFEEFVTFHPRSKDTGKGIGLGLAICKAIITAHGGEIIGENNEDGGAKFSFWLWAGKEETYGNRE